MPERVDRDQEDMLSELPLDVIGSILLKLSLKEAARTCLLSKNWRYRWMWKSEIVINDKCYRKIWYRKRWDLITPILSWLRNNHHGPIWRFELDAHYYPRGSDLDMWFSFLAEKGVREISLRNQCYEYRPDKIEYFDLPSSIFSSGKLSRLEISGGFKISSLNGSSSLKTLELNTVSINGEVLEGLLRCCVFLERLILVKISDLGFPRIRSHSLKFLKISSNFEDISLEGCPHLSELDITKLVHVGQLSQQFERGKPSNLFRIMGSLCYTLKKLTVSGFFLQFLGNGDLIRGPRVSFNHLITLEINDMKCNSPEDIAAAVELLISSPFLEKFYVSIASLDVSRLFDGYLEMTGDHSSMPLREYFDAAHKFAQDTLDRLRLAKLTGFRESKVEWYFLKWILAISPNIEKMIVVCKYTVIVKHIPESDVVKYEKAPRLGANRRLSF